MVGYPKLQSVSVNLWWTWNLEEKAAQMDEPAEEEEE